MVKVYMKCLTSSLITDVPLRWFSGKVVGRNNYEVFRFKESELVLGLEFFFAGVLFEYSFWHFDFFLLCLPARPFLVFRLPHSSWSLDIPSLVCVPRMYCCIDVRLLVPSFQLHCS